MSTADREEVTQCPCEGGMQNVEHVMSECEYVVEHLDEMIATVGCALRSEPESAQVKWLGARNVGERVAAIIGTEMRGVSPDGLGEVATGLKLLVRRSEKALRTVNKACESWPVDALAVWAPDADEEQMESQIDIASAGNQQMEAA